MPKGREVGARESEGAKWDKDRETRRWGDEERERERERDREREGGTRARRRSQAPVITASPPCLLRSSYPPASSPIPPFPSPSLSAPLPFPSPLALPLRRLALRVTEMQRSKAVRTPHWSCLRRQYRLGPGGADKDATRGHKAAGPICARVSRERCISRGGGGVQGRSKDMVHKLCRPRLA